MKYFRLSVLGWVAVVIGLILSIPVLSIVFSIFQDHQGNWEHLVSTVLPNYITNSLYLAITV